MKLEGDERIILKQGGPFSILRVYMDLTDRSSFPSLECIRPLWVYLTNKRIYVETWLPHFDFLALHFGKFADIPLSSITSVEKKKAGLLSFISVKYKSDSKIKTIVLDQTGNIDLWFRKIQEARGART